VLHAPTLARPAVARSASLWPALAVAALLAIVVLIAPTAPGDGRWTPAGSAGSAVVLPTNDPRVGETATVLRDGTVLVAGGRDPSGRTLASAELYDPRSRTWTPTTSMHVRRWHHTATLFLDGTVLVAGGTRSGDATGSPERYDPRSATWTLIRPPRMRG
jgi:hypothetical protein